MSKITRCPHCLESVYTTARVCPHCEVSLKKTGGRIFTRGAIAFMVVALIGWTVTDTVSILHEKQLRERRRQDDRRVEVSLRRLLEANDLSGKSDVDREVLALRNEHPEIFPAEIVDTVYVTRAGRSRLQQTSRGFTRTLFDGRRYRFSGLLSRGGQWFGIEGMLNVRGNRLAHFETHKVHAFGVTRPGWNGDRHLADVRL